MACVIASDSISTTFSTPLPSGCASLGAILHASSRSSVTAGCCVKQTPDQDPLYQLIPDVGIGQSGAIPHGVAHASAGETLQQRSSDRGLRGRSGREPAGSRADPATGYGAAGPHREAGRCGSGDRQDAPGAHQHRPGARGRARHGGTPRGHRLHPAPRLEDGPHPPEASRDSTRLAGRVTSREDSSRRASKFVYSNFSVTQLSARPHFTPLLPFVQNRIRTRAVGVSG